MLLRTPGLATLALAATVFATGAEPAGAPSYPAMPKAVSSFGAVESGGQLYIYGGHAGKTHHYDTDTVLGSFYRLKLDGGTKWEELPGGPKAQGLNLAAHGGKIYRLGGMQPRNKPGEAADNHSLTDGACFDPKTEKWEALPSLPAGRSSHDVAVAGSVLVVVGGWDMKGKGEKTAWHDTALVMDLSAAKPEWKSIPQSFKRRALAAAAVGAKVYVLGGLTSEGLDKSVDVLDVPSGKWSKGPAIPGTERAAFLPAVCVIRDRLLVNTADGPVYQLNEKGDGWEKVGAAAKKRVAARLVPLGMDRVILLGGNGGGANTDSVEVIALTKPEKIPGEK